MKDLHFEVTKSDILLGAITNNPSMSLEVKTETKLTTSVEVDKGSLIDAIFTVSSSSLK